MPMHPDMTRRTLLAPMVSGQFPQNLLRPSRNAMTGVTSAPWVAGSESRRNMAGLAGFAGAGLAGARLGALGDLSPGAMAALGVLSAASAGASAYHGYRRNRSVGWAVVWGLLGGMFPVVTPVVAIAQGFGKRRTR